METSHDPAKTIGTVLFSDGDMIDDILAAAVAGLRRDGLRVGGLLQHFGERLPGGKRSMWLEDLATGGMIRIDTPRGPGAQGCTLDTGGLAQAADALGQVAHAGADIAVVNRFARSEASGQGLRDEIIAILLAGIPLLIAVRDSMLPAWEDFIGSPAHLLAPDPVAIRAWVRCIVPSRPVQDAA